MMGMGHPSGHPTGHPLPQQWLQQQQQQEAHGPPGSLPTGSTMQPMSGEFICIGNTFHYSHYSCAPFFHPAYNKLGRTTLVLFGYEVNSLPGKA